MKKHFINNDDGRLRAGWRILIFIAIFMSLSLVVQTLVKSILGGVPKAGITRTFFAIMIAAFAATISVRLARRFLDKKSPVSLGLKLNARAAKDLLFGMVLSALMAASIFFIMKTAGLIEVSGLNWGAAPGGSDTFTLASYLAIVSFGSLALLFFMDVVVGWWEELVFRGYLLQNMIEGLGLKVAIGFSCILYGLVHTTNPNAGLLSTAIIIFFGFLRIYGYLATRQLWLSIGMHIGWNFFQGPIFGYAASGLETANLIAQSPRGPAWLSGGAFGPEASVLVIPIIGLALLVMRWWVKMQVNRERS